MEKGEVLGLVGESGCGKSTLAKVILGLLKPDSGTVIVSGNRPQMVFQDPYGSLNPAKKIGWIMEDVYKRQSLGCFHYNLLMTESVETTAVSA